MKKSLFFAKLGAIALAFAGFVSCSTEDTVTVDNPNYDPETNTVNADFVFSVATSNSASTRMSGEDVQAVVDEASKFRGIQNAYLIGYSQKTGDSYNDGKILTTPTASSKYFDLPALINKEGLQGTGTAANTDKSRRVIELSIPTGTNTFTFYGKAPITATGANGLNSSDKQGKITYSVVPADITNNAFTLTARAAEKKTKIENVETVISTIITRIINNGMNNGSSQTNATVSWDGHDYINNVTLDWKNYAKYDSEAKKWLVRTTSPVKLSDGTPTTVTEDNSGIPITALEEILGNVFVSFVNIPNRAVRAGSGPSIARLIGDMAVSVGKVANAEPTSFQEAVAQAMAKRILTRFEHYFDVGVNTVTGDFTGVITSGSDCDWLTSSNIIEHLLQYEWDNDNTNETYKKISDTDTGVKDNEIKKFPTEFEVPMGAAQLLINPATLVASYNSANNIFFGGTDEYEKFDISKIAYPAELCYFGNSPINVTDATKAVSDYPDGAGNGENEWLNDGSWTDWTKNNHVVSSTRSVAMNKNVNYGTALFETKVGYTSGLTKLKDNNSALHPGEEDGEINVTSTAFTVTGILIGGQSNTVGWNFLPVDGADKNFVVYDKIADALYDGTRTGELSIPAPEDGVSSTNYTLLWDNYASSGSQQDVYVAIEFYNNSGKDFWGKHNMIRNGGTFYIVGKLEVNKAGLADITWPTDHPVPPYTDAGASREIKRIFIQDFVTKATFRLGQNSLKEAYVTVPDLRSTQMSFGLSVDLTWETGLDFGDVILGRE